MRETQIWLYWPSLYIKVFDIAFSVLHRNRLTARNKGNKNSEHQNDDDDDNDNKDINKNNKE